MNYKSTILSRAWSSTMLLCLGCSFVIPYLSTYVLASSDEHSIHPLHDNQYITNEDSEGLSIPIPPGISIMPWADARHQRTADLHLPKKGRVVIQYTGSIARNFIYTPHADAEGLDRFTFWAVNDNNYTVTLLLVPSEDELEVFTDSALETLSGGNTSGDRQIIKFKENQREADAFFIFDPDTFEYGIDQSQMIDPVLEGGTWSPSNPNNIRFELVVEATTPPDSNFSSTFELITKNPEFVLPSVTASSGWKIPVQFATKDGKKLDYEEYFYLENLDTSYDFQVDFYDSDVKIYSRYFTMEIENEAEGPTYNPVQGDGLVYDEDTNTWATSWITLEESENDELIQSSTPKTITQILSFSSEPREGGESGKFYLQFSRPSSYSHSEEKRATVKVNGSVLDYQPENEESNDQIGPFDSLENIAVEIIHDIENAFGSQTYRFVPVDTRDGKSGTPVDIKIRIENDDSDLSYFVEEDNITRAPDYPSFIQKDVPENFEEFFHNLNSNDPDAHIRASYSAENSGGRWYYHLPQLADNNHFDINNTSGELSFKEGFIPDYEQKIDLFGGSYLAFAENPNDGNYLVVIRLYDSEPDNDAESPNDELILRVMVENVSEPPSLVYGYDVREIEVQQYSSWEFNPLSLEDRMDVVSPENIDDIWSVDWNISTRPTSQSGHANSVFIQTGAGDGKNGPETFTFTPSTELGASLSASFQIQYNVKVDGQDGYDGSGTIIYNVTIIDVPDPPFLKKVFKSDSQGSFNAFLDTIDPSAGPGRTNYQINFFENQMLDILLEFSAEGDGGQTIQSVEVVRDEQSDISSFTIEENYQNQVNKVRLSLVNSDKFDYEVMGEMNFFLNLSAVDSGGDMETFRLNFVFTNVDEPPIVIENWEVWGNESQVEEEQDFVLTLTATDPEGGTSFSWGASPSEGILFDYPNSPQTDVVNLKYSPDHLPNFEVSEEQNVTYYVEDESGQRFSRLLQLKFQDVTDPPKLKNGRPTGEMIEVLIKENQETALELSDYFLAEGATSIQYSIDGDEDTLDKFSISSDGLRVIFRNPLKDNDYENPDVPGQGYAIKINAQTDYVGEQEHLNFKIIIENVLQEPNIAFDREYNKISFEDPDAAPPWIINQSILGASLEEDAGPYEIDLNLTIQNPANPNSIVGVSVLEPMDSYFVPLENGNFQLTPPPNHFGPLEIDLNLSDGGMPSYLKLILDIIDTPDAPTFSLTDEDGDKVPGVGVPGMVDSTLEANNSVSFTMDEGVVVIGTLTPFDYKDSFEEGKDYYWILEGDESYHFAIQNGENGEAVLFWNLSHPSLNWPTTRYDSPVIGHSFNFDVILAEKPGFGTDNDQNDNETYIRAPFSISLRDSTIPPIFEPTSTLGADGVYPLHVLKEDGEFFCYFKELRTEPIALLAVDYDNDTLLPGDPTTLIRFDLGTSVDSTKFEILEDDLLGNAKLAFKEAPDYENPRDFNSDNEYRVLLKATKFERTYDPNDENVFTDVDTEFSSQIYLTVKMVNTVESPFFPLVPGSGDDANFSMDEQTDQTFLIEAITDDYDKDFNVSLLNEGDGKYFKTVSSNGGFVEFSFSLPPDYENPRDQNNDNLYDVSFFVKTNEETANFTETITVQVLNLDSILEIKRNDGKPFFDFNHSENRSFVTDFDVLDREGTAFGSKGYPDLVLLSNKGVHYASNSWEENDSSTLFENSPSGKLDENDVTLEDLNGFDLNTISPDPASFAVYGDIDNDGSIDVITFTSSNINVFYNDGLGEFTQLIPSNTHPFLSTLPAGSALEHAILVDLDTDGDEDLVVAARLSNRVHIFENHQDPDAIGFVQPGEGYVLDNAEHGISRPRFLAASDVNGDGSLDLVVINSDKEEVVWYKNLGDLKFELGGVVIEGITNPTCLEVVDIDNALNFGDPFACGDFLIGATQGIYLARNDGRGNFLSSIVVSGGTQNSGFDESFATCNAIKAINLNNDPNIDFVYITSGSASSTSQARPYYVLQSIDGFAGPYAFPELLDPHELKEISTTSFLEAYLVDDGEGEPIPYVFLSDENRPHVWVYKAERRNTTPEIIFAQPSTFLAVEDSSAYVRGNIASLGVADLNTKSNFVKFRISGGENRDLFDSGKIVSGGKLFFTSPPDYESPLEEDLTYRVDVQAYIGDDPENAVSSTEVSVMIKVSDANDPPSIDLLVHQDGDVPGSDEVIFLPRPENILEVVERIDFSNHEADENVTFSISGGVDQDLFTINPQTGRLSFSEEFNILTQSNELVPFPNDNVSGIVNFLELPSFSNDSNYSVVIRATDEGGEVDEQEIIIGIQDATEVPTDIVISSYDALSLTIDEDTTAVIADLESLITHNNGNNLKFDIYEHIGLNLGHAEILTLPGQSNFYYYPDANLSGRDQVLITVDDLEDTGNPLFCVALSIEVISVPDPPVSRVSTPITIDENQKYVVDLKGFDGDPNELLSWSLSDVNDPIFKIVNDKLYFQLAPDFEDPHALAHNNVYTAELNLYDKDQLHAVPIILEVVVQNLPDTKPSSILLSGQENLIQRLEGENVIANLEASDPDAVHPGQADGLTILLGGIDATHFSIVDGILKVFGGASLDFENPLDANRDNLYELEIYIGDADLGDTYYTTVEILDLDESPPYFITGQGQVPYEIPVEENQKFIVQAVATDAETSDLVFSVVGGGEEDFFIIDSRNGLLEFKDGQNFEYPADDNNDGRFEVIIAVSDGTHQVNQTIVVRLTDVNDIPYVLGADNDVPNFEPGSYSFDEDTSYTANFQIIDEDGDAYTFEPYSPATQGTFSINQTSFTYTPEPNFMGTDTFVVKVADEQGSRLQTLQLKARPVDDPPVAEKDDIFYGDLNEKFPIYFDVLANDHAGPDDSSEEQFYEVQTLTLPKFGLLQEVESNSNSGKYYYTPSGDFIGEDTFQYSLIDRSKLGSTSVGLARIWIAKTASMPHITTLRNFGYYLESDTNWIYSLRMGWLYVKSVQGLFSTTWAWHDQVGWFWTGEEYFEWLYYNDESKWLHWEGGINDSASWFLRDAQDKVYSANYFEKKKVRSEVSNILPSLDDLAAYINESSYFTNTQKSQILRELVFTRSSSTLNRILEFEFSY